MLAALLLLPAGCAQQLPPADGTPAAKQRANQPDDQPELVAKEAGEQQPHEAGPGPAPALSEPYWPNWRGPQHDGIARQSGWSARWPAGGPPVAWQAQVGIGFSSVSVAGGKLYTMGHVDGEDQVVCLDASTGQPLWQHRYRCELVDNLHEGGPGATPTLDGQRVYTLSREGHLFCLDADSGEVQWFSQLEEELGVKHPEWGFTCSPLVLGEKLIVDVGRVAALDKHSGELLWQTERYRPGYGSAVSVQRGGELLVAVFNNDGLIVVRSENGELVDHFPWETQYATTSATPVLVAGSLFISSGYNRGCALLRLEDGQLKPVYQNTNMRNHFNNSVLWEGHLYGIDGNSHASSQCRLVCMDAANGEVKWSRRGFGCGSLLVADGKLVILSDDGELATAEATPDGYRELARAPVLDGRCWTVPVLAGSRIYCRNASGRLVCVDVGGQ